MKKILLVLEFSEKDGCNFVTWTVTKTYEVDDSVSLNEFVDQIKIKDQYRDDDIVNAYVITEQLYSDN